MHIIVVILGSREVDICGVLCFRFLGVAFVVCYFTVYNQLLILDVKF